MKARNKILFGVGVIIVIIVLFSTSMIYFNKNGMILESDYNHDPNRVLAHCAQQKYGEENNWKTPDGTNFIVTSIGLYAMNDTHYIDNNLCTWIERPPGIDSMLSGDELKFYKQKLVNDKSDSVVKILQGAVIEDNETLDPEIITVVLGTNNTVTWINHDDVAHTLSSNYENNLWWTELIKPGESSSVTFNSTGVFSYHGTPSPWISGAVIVLPDVYEKSTLPSSDDFDFKRIHMHNACTEEPSYCFGVFENGTQILTQCDFPIHGCGPVSFDDYVDVENEN